jgi:hypothetical protein
MKEAGSGVETPESDFSPDDSH